MITYQWGGASWLAPALGRRQVYRIIDSMLASDAGYSRGASFARLPRAALPPGALVVVFSPLLDQRFVEALRDMRERGFSMLVVDVLNTEPPARRRMEDRLARRLWRMEQEAIRFSLRELGVPVVHWDGEESLDLPLAAHTRRPMAARRDRHATAAGPWPTRAGRGRRGGMRAAAVLLGAGCLIWAALPAVHRGYATFVLVLAIAGVAAGGLRLALAAVPVPEETYWPSPGVRAWRAFLDVMRQVPWEEGAVIGIAWLEVLHPSRPWHTAVLGAGLIAYLLVVHLAESDARLATLRPQARVLGLGAARARAGAGAGMLPAAGPALVRRCCGWWRREPSSPRPAWSSPTSRGMYNRRQGTTQRRAGPDG